jgi:hypothetical protein
MTKRTTLLAALALFTSGCAKTGTDAPAPAPTGDATAGTPPADAPADRPALTDAECQAKGGTVVGDIGDGAIHKPDYKCEGGQPPLGSIRAEGDAPVAVEGSVCCPAAAPAPAA